MKNVRVHSITAAICVAILTLFTALPGTFSQQQRRRPRLIIVFVVDGLRPDSINRDDTPTLDRLRREGVSYLNAHCVFPSVTRVNAAAISTGTYPARNGLVSNSMFHAGVNPSSAFDTGDWRELGKLASASSGRLLYARSLGERLAENGVRFAVVSSGSTGNALLLNHHAPLGKGVLVNGNFDPGKRVAFPDETNATVLAKFGPAPAQEGARLVDWTDRVLRDYILGEYRPEVVIDWLTEPDGSQHRFGVGSREARTALYNSDRSIGQTLERIVELGLGNDTDVFVLSDHGFSWHNHAVNVVQELVRGGLKSAAESDDVVVASNGQSVLMYVKNHDAARIARLVRFLNSQPWVDVVFTKAPVAGAFSLELIHGAHPERATDILFTLPWSSSPNVFQAVGTHYVASNSTGALTGPGSGHGGLSPWSMRNTIIAWGADFKPGIAVRVPASNVDIAPTILSLLGLPGAGEMDGRILEEALRSGPDPERIIAETHLHRVPVTGGGASMLQVTTVGRQKYVEKGWRVR